MTAGYIEPCGCSTESSMFGDREILCKSFCGDHWRQHEAEIKAIKDRLQKKEVTMEKLGTIALELTDRLEETLGKDLPEDYFSSEEHDGMYDMIHEVLEKHIDADYKSFN